MSFIIILSIFMFALGASIGSFINMAAYRIPQNLSIVSPRSYCNNCKQTLQNIALIPIIGYFLSKGKCRKCEIRVPLEYPLVEILAGMFFVFLFFYYEAFIYLPFSFNEYLNKGMFIQLLTALWLFSTGLLLSLIDFKHRILPDVIVIPGILINFILGSLNKNIGMLDSFCGILVGGLGLYLVSKLYELIRKREGMGFGDVKYLAFIGAATGVYGVVFTLFFASVIGSIIGITALLIQRKNLHTPIPFGPFLAISALIYFMLSKNFSF